MMTVKERLSAFRAAMAESDCDVFIIPSSDPHSSEYATAHDTAWEYFSGFSCENANLVIAKESAALWVDGRFFGAADSALKDTGIDSMHMGVKGVPTVYEWIKENVKENMTLGYCATTMPLSQKRKLQKICDENKAKLLDLPLVDRVWVENRPALPSSEAWILDTKYAGVSAKEKLDTLRGILDKEGCTATLVTTLDSVAWLLNLRAADVDNTPYALAFCYVDKNEAVLFIDSSRILEKAKKTLSDVNVKLMGYSEMPEFIANGKNKETVLIDPSTLNAALDNALRGNSNYKVIEGKNPIAMLKAVKNETELACTKKAHINDGVSMVRFQMELEKRLASGEKLRETDIDTILHKYRSSVDGFITESFPTIAAYGENAAKMHYAPMVGADAVIEKKGFLLVDSGATYYDGTTDITRTYAVGELTEEEKLAYTRVLRCHIDVAMAVWKDGATGGELDMLARQPLWRYMLDYRCGTGHSVSHVGAVHEGPHSLRPHNSIAFVPGMIVTDEPGIYEDGKIGIRIENELVCAEAGESEYGKFLRFEPITYVPIDMSCVLVDELTREERAYINEYHSEVYNKLSPLLNDEEKEWLGNKCQMV